MLSQQRPLCRLSDVTSLRASRVVPLFPSERTKTEEIIFPEISFKGCGNLKTHLQESLEDNSGKVHCAKSCDDQENDFFSFLIFAEAPNTNSVTSYNSAEASSSTLHSCEVPTRLPQICVSKKRKSQSGDDHLLERM